MKKHLKLILLSLIYPFRSFITINAYRCSSDFINRAYSNPLCCNNLFEAYLIVRFIFKTRICNVASCSSDSYNLEKFPFQRAQMRWSIRHSESCAIRLRRLIVLRSIGRTSGRGLDADPRVHLSRANQPPRVSERRVAQRTLAQRKGTREKLERTSQSIYT